MTEYSINGVPLSTFASRIETWEGLQSTPDPVGEDVLVPGVDGALDVYQLGQQRRPDSVGLITFSMWLKGVDPDTGEWTSETTDAEYLANVDDMVRLFFGRPLEITAERAYDTTRVALARLSSRLDFTAARSSPRFGQFVATCVIPGAHWTDTEDVTTEAQSLATGGTLSLAAFAAATAPCTELVVTFGPGSNPKLLTDYGWLAWDGVIAAGQELVLNTSSGITSYGDGTAWTPGYSSLDYSPGPRYFEIDPSQALEATLEHTGGGSMSVEVSGRRRYRTS